MFIHPEGYAFDGHIDNANKIGIKEGYDLVKDGSVLTLGFMQNGDIAPSYFIDKDIGFQLFTDKVRTDQDLQTFLRSHKGTYVVLGDCLGIVMIKLMSGENDKVVISSTDFYIPIKDIRCDSKSVIICEKLDIHQGLHTRIIEENVLSQYDSKVRTIVEKYDLSTRENAMIARMFSWKEG